ncbi:hypothetical protein [Actinomadura keratinilytica]|jgi:hypothetical protein|uniref:Uncharacterized protein n=1 Tax=Actinomadura keratinilytica TaxID=547461 RepID=A0ABP7XYW2_9ACTN
MVDLTEYERRGDLDAPFELTRKHERAQKTAERIREAVRCDVAPLTWEAYVAGEPCPGCGLPYRDGEPWDFKGTMYFTEEERARYDAEEARFKKAHGDCRSHRHSVSGSLTMHCGKCCPPPPLSPRQIEKIGRLLGTPKQPHELMRWRLRLYCGHVVEEQAHYTHKTLHSAFTGSTSCPECGLDPATIVDGEAVGLVEEPPGPAKPSPAAPPRRSTKPRKPTRAELEARVRELEAEVARLRGS